MRLGGNKIIKSVVEKRGYRHRRPEDQFTLVGDYAGNLQYVYSKQRNTQDGPVVDLLYFGVDIFNEKLVIGFYRENPTVENGVYENKSDAIPLLNYSQERLEKVLNQLIPPIKTDMH